MYVLTNLIKMKKDVASLVRSWTEAQKKYSGLKILYFKSAITKVSLFGSYLLLRSHGIIISLKGFEINNLYVPINIGFVLECSLRLPSKQ